jgi:hypothetical protein
MNHDECHLQLFAENLQGVRTFVAQFSSIENAEIYMGKADSIMHLVQQHGTSVDKQGIPEVLLSEESSVFLFNTETNSEWDWVDGNWQFVSDSCVNVG